MNETPTPNTVDRNLIIHALRLPEDTPPLTPGDVIHIEATLTVQHIINGLTYKDEPTVTITARATDTPEVVIRTEGTYPWSALEDDQEAPTDRERITTRLKTAGARLWRRA